MRTGPEAAPTFSGPRLSCYRASDTGAMPLKSQGTDVLLTGRDAGVFTGPVFEGDDPEIDGVKIPRRFWKVAAWVRPDGSMGAAGFIVSQEELLAAMGLEATAEQVARTFQTHIREIEKLTKL